MYIPHFSVCSLRGRRCKDKLLRGYPCALMDMYALGLEHNIVL